jgi:hypothetical protein
LIDLLAAPYQPLVERELTADALGGAFPYEGYGKLLKQVLDVGPRAVVPGSCGFRYTTSWMNDRGFPLTEGQFLKDIADLDPSILGLPLAPGTGVDIGRRIGVRNRRLPFVTLTSDSATPSHDWRPDRGVPPLVDTNPSGHSVSSLRKRVTTYLDGAFLDEIQSPSNRIWRDRLARLDVAWRLEVTYPDGTVDTRVLEFGKMKYLTDSARVYSKLHTAVTASSIVGALRGERNTYSTMLGLGTRRVAVRLYDTHRGGVASAGNASDDPLARVLFRGADDRFIDAELKRLGY